MLLRRLQTPASGAHNNSLRFLACKDEFYRRPVFGSALLPVSAHVCPRIVRPHLLEPPRVPPLLLADAGGAGAGAGAGAALNVPPSLFSLLP
ncbi:unnamed protein product [Closterium sp. NIES-54]